MTEYDVYQRGDQWVGKRADASRISVAADTQQQAYEQTREIAGRNGGAEISIHGRNGQIREKNTISPAKDPRGTKG